MITASSRPTQLSSWLGNVARGLLIGYPPSCPPVAYDSTVRTEASTTAPLTFASSPLAGSAALYTRTITRASGSFIDDGWYPGFSVAPVGSINNDGSYDVVARVDPLTLTLTPSPVAFTAESAVDDVELMGTAQPGFQLFVGPQHRNTWTGADVCVLVPAGLTEAVPMAIEGQPPILAAHALILDVHIWGGPGEEVPGILGDCARYDRADWIWQEVRRSIQIASRGMMAAIQSADFANETEILRYGESMLVRLAVASFPVYDAFNGAITGTPSLQFTTSIRPPGV